MMHKFLEKIKKMKNKNPIFDKSISLSDLYEVKFTIFIKKRWLNEYGKE